jgi:hypothetical protein
MSWRTTLVEPIAHEAPTLVQVTCIWCTWSEGLFDAATEEGRAAVRGVRIDHACQSPQTAPEGS